MEREMRILALMLLITGIVLLAYSGFRGDLRFSLFFIIPIIYGTGGYAALGVLLTFMGVLLLFLTPFFSLTTAQQLEPPKTEKKWGGVIFIGPLPIIFGSDTKIALILAVVGLLLLLLLIFLL